LKILQHAGAEFQQVDQRQWIDRFSRRVGSGRSLEIAARPDNTVFVRAQSAIS